MAESGATTWWETFRGDELDSLCHMWSCVPGELIVSEILGVQPAAPGLTGLTIRPRFDLLAEAEAAVPLPQGEVQLGWRSKSDDPRRLALRVVADAPGWLELPAGWAVDHNGARRLELPAGRELKLIVARRRASDYPSVLNVLRRQPARSKSVPKSRRATVAGVCRDPTVRL